jgi:hypothetical protein
MKVKRMVRKEELTFLIRVYAPHMSLQMLPSRKTLPATSYFTQIQPISLRSARTTAFPRTNITKDHTSAAASPPGRMFQRRNGRYSPSARFLGEVRDWDRNGEMCWCTGTAAGGLEGRIGGRV